MATSHPIAVPDRSRAVLGLAIGAALVTICLNGVAFWLSYEALHDLATGHHLSGARAWAWPATLDAFVIVGDLLILRASLLRRLDWFAMILVGVGSAGSIILNVVSVGADVDPVSKVVAAVPPVAATVAFAALMRQIYRALTAPARPADPERTTIGHALPAGAPVTAVTAPAPPLPPTPPALPPVTYADERCAVIRPLYDGGHRPGTKTMRAALTAAGHLGTDGRELSDGTIRGRIRAEVEQHEPHLALLPEEPAAIRVA